MAAQPVEAVWVWYFGTAAQKATYGRFLQAGDKSYTKDFLQVSGDCSKLLEELFPAPETTDLVYRWPGGEAAGSIKHPNDRHHLRWSTTQKAPDPWRLTLDPSEQGPGTIPGDPGGVNISEADAALAEYAALGLDAYLVAVKLVDEEKVLHIRAYIRNPPAQLSFADTAQMPASVQELVAKAIPSHACASAVFGSTGSAMTPEVASLIDKLEENPNLLLIGPPGTGKSVVLDKLARYIEDPAGGVLFDPDKNHDAWAEATDTRIPGKSRTVVFHPSYSYDNLVVGLLPTPADHGVGVKVATGPLVNLAQYASKGGNRALLVLDEFNRGNAAGILGDALALLDRDKRGVATIDLPFSDLTIEVPEEFAADGNRVVDPRFTLPPNLWVVAAMNSSDRSVAPLDAALRRRFSILEMDPDYDLLSVQIQADEEADLNAEWGAWTPGSVSKLAVLLLEALNTRIDAALGRDFALGHSNFWHVGGESSEDALRSLAVAWDRRIVHTLRLALQDDDDALAVIVRAGLPSQATTTAPTRAFWWKAADPALGAYARARLHFNELALFDTADLLAELRRLAGA